LSLILARNERWRYALTHVSQILIVLN